MEQCIAVEGNKMKSVRGLLFRVSIGIVLLGPLCLLPSSLWPESGLGNGPTRQAQEIAARVAAALEQHHFTRQALDDEISRRCLGNFLKNLDPMKMYFTAQDVEEFSRFRDRLDDDIRARNLDFAYLVFRRFQVRVDERVKLVDELLAEEHDFTVQESMVADSDATRYATSEAEVRDLWRRRIKYDLLPLRAEVAEAERNGAGAWIWVGPDGSACALPTNWAWVVPEGWVRVASDRWVWEDPSVWESLSASAGDAAALDPVARLTKRYHNFQRTIRQTDDMELLESYLYALATSYDPHTSYMSPRTLENFEINMKLELEGIGAALRSEDGFTIVSEIIPGGAADRDGRLKSGDKIVGVGRIPEEEVLDVVDMKLSDVVQLVRGPRGTIVRLQVIPAGEAVRTVYTLTRDRVLLKDAEAYGEVIPHGQRPDGTPYNVGVIDLPSFYRDMEGAESGVNGFKSTTRDVRKILARFREEKVDVVMVDLRQNGGGALTEAIELTGLFIDEGPVVLVKDDDVSPYDDEDPGMAWSGPLVVLTSRDSASASEIFAGAIQDYRRGIIVGDPTTHGKGTVQQLKSLNALIRSREKLGALKLTTQQFYRPSGASTQNLGVESDIKLPYLTSEFDDGEASRDYALPFDKVAPVPVRDEKRYDAELLQRLTDLSLGRRGEQEEFQKLERTLARIRRNKQQREVTLNEEEYRAKLAEAEADRIDEPTRLAEALPEGESVDEDLAGVETTKERIRIDYYLKEALSITADYVRLGPPNCVAGSM